MGNDQINAAAALTRREFCGRAGAAALSFTVLSPAVVRGTQANSRLRLGVIGCGGRGTWIAELFRNHGGYEIASAYDNRLVTWEQLLADGRRLSPRLEGLRD